MSVKAVVQKYRDGTSDEITPELLALLPYETWVGPWAWDTDENELALKDPQLRSLKMLLAHVDPGTYVVLDACYSQRNGERLDAVLAAWREKGERGDKNVFGLLFEVPRHLTLERAPVKVTDAAQDKAKSADELYFAQHPGKLCHIRKRVQGEDKYTSRWVVVFLIERKPVHLPWPGRGKPSEKEADEIRRLFVIGMI